ncbi:LysR family transcriptional regulator [Gallaecimonas sp. GXIMD4217]|uniref:LysR family transcriptional regulator n=1 Tax=Gallaecimonas sp. GXIMD4217 TaxID=3131927 RepID=UPI00311B36BA
MELSQLAKCDLNLLISLQALLEHQSVSKAAQSLHLSQSAMSKTLGRLRQLFGDPLFVRQGQGLRPTARAESLRPALAELLPRLQGLFEPLAFDPATSSRNFRLSIIDGAHSIFMPAWLPALRRAAPRVTLDCGEWQKDGFERLAKGERDLALMAMDEPMAPLPPDFHAKVLLEDHYLCVCHRDNPRLQGGWDRARFLDWPQVNVSCETDLVPWLPDSVLWEAGLRRPVVMQVATLQAALQAVLVSDLLTVLPASYANRMQAIHPIHCLPLPVELPLTKAPLKQLLIWHQRRHDDMGVRWLADFILAQVKGSETQP